MVAALITAVSAVLVAVVALLGPRIEARDSRNRIARDIDALTKLRDTSPARKILHNHVTESVVNLVAAEKMREDYGPRTFLRNFAIVLGLAAFATAAALGGEARTSVLEFLHSMAPTLFWIFLVGSAAAMLLYNFMLWSDNRTPRDPEIDNRRMEIASLGEGVASTAAPAVDDDEEHGNDAAAGSAPERS
jgi:Flp pilus assembly protein TadB